MAGKQNEDGARAFLWPVTSAITAVFISLLIIVLSLLVMCFYLWRFVPEAQAQAHLNETAAYYVDNAIASDRAASMGQLAQQLVLQETGIAKIASRQASADSAKPGFWRRTMGITTDIWDITNKTIYILGAKLSSVISALPLILLLCFVSIIDGMGARYIRREEGGNESATRYHLYKSVSHSWLPTFMLIAFLLCPFAVEPLWFVLPTAIVIVIGLRSQIQYFKKYL